MSENGTEREQVAGIPVVMTSRTWKSGEGPVHREEKPHRCGSAPVGRSGEYTDLDTSTVVGDRHLCPNCEWPALATEFLRSLRTGTERVTVDLVGPVRFRAEVTEEQLESIKQSDFPIGEIGEPDEWEPVGKPDEWSVYTKGEQ